MSNKIWAIGSIGIDMLAFAPALPKAGETMAGSDFLTAPGGKGLNQAIACARLGAPTIMIGCRGDDNYGKVVTDYMKDSGVDVSRVRTVSNMYTGTAVIFVAENGQNSIIVVPGANGKVVNEDVVNLPYQKGDYVVAQFEVPLPVTLTAFKAAQAKGAKTVLNPSPVLEGAQELISAADYVVLNEVELAIYSGKPVTAETADGEIEHVARNLIRHDGQTIVTTLGPRGAIAVNRQEVVSVKGLKVQAIDTVGAGDTFAGGLAVRLLAGDSLKHALEFANVAASLSVQKQGAAPSIPTLAEVRNQKAAA
jgi:ribokinase